MNCTPKVEQNINSNNDQFNLKYFVILKIESHTQIPLTMNTRELKSAEQYNAPDIEVIEIALTQNILTASLPDVGDGGDAW